ncbi:hypothetical protein KAR91_53460 [Candidatus Pacearchaeota archaeon]|nr:hypothetical protein [Candidatus Pacearchaeota archaeon]
MIETIIIAVLGVLALVVARIADKRRNQYYNETSDRLKQLEDCQRWWSDRRVKGEPLTCGNCQEGFLPLSDSRSKICQHVDRMSSDMDIEQPAQENRTHYSCPRK